MDIIQANAVAQQRFREMLAAGTLADPDAPETRAYVAAERVMDDIITAAQWEASEAAWDALEAADGITQAKAADDWAGDHYIYPAGVGR